MPQDEQSCKIGQWWWLVLFIPLLASLCLPSAREMHRLCLRMHLHLHGDTMVQGQMDSCIISTVPNVVFTEEHQTALRKVAAHSPDQYVLASSTADIWNLDVPAVSTWTNHALLKWGALQLASIAYQSTNESNRTNGFRTAIGEVALPLVRYAQLVDQTNGAYWLAEAALEFSKKNDLAALVALRTAASNNLWRADTKNTYTSIASLFLKSGFSKLDASTVANSLSFPSSALILQENISRNLNRLMAEAIRSNDDEQFNRLFGLLVELRKARWDEHNYEYVNRFRYFRYTDELVDAMALRFGTVLPPASDLDNFDRRQKLRPQVFKDFLEGYGDSKSVARFWGQSDSSDAINSLHNQLDGLRTNSLMFMGAMSSAAGAAASLMLAALVVVVLCELPFIWQGKTPGAFGCWPRNAKFWLTAVVAVGLGLFVFTDIQQSIGLYSKAGFRMETEPERFSAQSEAFLAALVLCGVWFSMMLTVRKVSKKPVNTWLGAGLFAAAYFTMTIVAGVFRDRTIDLLQANWF